MSGANVVFNGRDNTFDIALTKNDVPLSAAFVTGAAVAVYDKKHGTLIRTVNGRLVGSADRSSFDFSQEQVVPGGGDDAIRIIKIKLGILAGTPTRIPPARNYYAELIIYSVTEPQGTVWAMFPLEVLQETSVV